MLDFNGSGELTARYLSGPGPDGVVGVLARDTASGGVAWYLTDRLGSVGDIVNNSGSVLDRVDYSAYGQVLDQSDPSEGDRFLYAGMQYDSATGLYYDDARWYDPATGRFITEDPTGFAPGDSDLYRYAGNNVVAEIDPSGLAGTDPAPSVPTSLPIGNPSRTLVLVGPPNLKSGSPDTAFTHVDSYLTSPDVGMSENDIVHFNGLADLKKQLHQRFSRELKFAPFTHIIIWTHSHPGSLLSGSSASGVNQRIDVDEPDFSENVRRLGNILRSFDASTINLVGCDTLSYVDGGGRSDGNTLLRSVKDATGATTVTGTIGTIAVQNSAQTDYKPGLLISRGGSIAVS